jgi:hypothetical protein
MKRLLVNVCSVAIILCCLVMALLPSAYGQGKNPPLNVNVVNTPSVSISGTVPVTGPLKEIINFSFPITKVFEGPDTFGKETITFPNPATVETVFAFCQQDGYSPYYLTLNGYASTSTTATVTGDADKNSAQGYILGPVPKNTTAFPLNVPVGMKLEVEWVVFSVGIPISFYCNVEVVFHY